MSLRSIETEIVHEARVVTGIKTLRVKDIQEWSTTAVKAEGDEQLAFLPKLGIHIAYLTPGKKTTKVTL